ncbi:MAG TPA: DUF559 domain-containing protein [Thermoanaerobaculia bacterium]|nr:DUF559 domain-containing protein [Thermoanaerobaculia bacterium]
MERVEQRSRRRAREFRKESTPAEEALWEKLRDRQILGLTFRRQVPINRYIADSVAPSCGSWLNWMAPSMTPMPRSHTIRIVGTTCAPSATTS